MAAPSFVVVLDPDASGPALAQVLSTAGDLVHERKVTRGASWAAIAVGDGVKHVDVDSLTALPAVRAAVPVTRPYRLASREVFGEPLAVELPLAGRLSTEERRTRVGGRAPLCVIASSRWASASESRLRILAPLLYEAGCTVFHAGRLVPAGDREVPGELTPEGLARLREIVHEHGLALSVEISDESQIESAEEIADLLQVGSPNMQDFSLLSALGRTDRPVLLRRGAGATAEEFLLAAEYILVHGNGRVIMCESGIRTFDAVRSARFEINAVPLVKQLTHLPLVAAPSQTAPNTASVPAMARAAIAAGADGLVLEVEAEASHDPEGVAIDIATLRRLMADLRPIARAVGRSTSTFTVGDQPAPPDAAAVLRLTERTLAQTIESLTGAMPELEVIGQGRLQGPVPSWLSPPLSTGSSILTRATSYRMGAVRLSRNLAYVDLGLIDPTLAALLETKQLNLGQLFVDPRIEKRDFEFGTQEDAGELDPILRRFFEANGERLQPYAWRRYSAAIDGVVKFVVIEALPLGVWDRVLENVATSDRGPER